MPEPDDSSVALATRVGASARVCEVVSSTSLTPNLREVVLGGEAVELGGVPGQDVMVRLATASGRWTRRRFSVRRVDPDARTLTLWVTVDHEGPGVSWAEGAQPGDPVDVVGPRGKIPLANAPNHLFCGDASSLAATWRLAESVTGGSVTIAVEVDDVADVTVAPLAEGVAPRLVMVERRDRGYDDPTGLMRALADIDVDAATTHAYLFGEFHVANALRVAVLDLGVEESAVSLKAYWRAGRGNADNGEPERD
ncbi:MAG TPA: siderophore-interacting protein [Acidimicrobiales bacterium]|nr:siderophore-interacting protein [Acidimicrobiales bacterium]